MPVVLEVSRRGSNSQVLGGLAGVAWSTSDDEMEDDDEDDDYEVDEDAHAEDGGEVAGADVKKVGCRVKKGMANRGGAVRGRVGDSAAITRGGAEVGKGSLSLKSARTTKKQIQLPPLVSRKECLQILYDQDDDVYEHSFTFRSNEGIHLNESETEQRQCLRQEQEQMQQQECQLRQEGEQEGYHDFSSCIDGGYRPGSRPENNNWIQFVYDSHLAASQHAYLEYYCGDAGEGHVTPPEAQQHYHRQPSSHHGQNVYQSPHGRRPMHGQRLGRGDMSGESESVASFDLFNEMAEEPGGAETSLLFGSCTEPDKFVAAAAAAPLIHVSGLDIERLIADPSVAPPVGGECGSMGVGGGFQFLV
ncbi:hypothetical protein BC830DRAFT_1108400 [Chytriomyces sp. MP71]|nr:hypothetical protein BC830DRAFT_1108400 [Chytriomyces sp. MP71]